MLDSLKREVYEANMRLKTSGLVILTWGNASGYDQSSGLVVIKPSGVKYSELTPEKMVVVDLDGKIIEGDLKPSSDTATHLKLYKEYPKIGGIVHTHSKFATSFAQAGRSVKALGTTHADYFYGEIPCSTTMTKEQINGNYEEETGQVIIDTISGEDPFKIPAVLINEHGPFTWGRTIADAVYHSIVLEEVCSMAFYALSLNGAAEIQKELLDKHYNRKHGKNSYYGQ